MGLFHKSSFILHIDYIQFTTSFSFLKTRLNDQTACELIYKTKNQITLNFIFLVFKSWLLIIDKIKGKLWSLECDLITSLSVLSSPLVLVLGLANFLLTGPFKSLSSPPLSCFVNPLYYCNNSHGAHGKSVWLANPLAY